jgi:hypothetical protein
MAYTGYRRVRNNPDLTWNSWTDSTSNSTCTTTSTDDSWYYWTYADGTSVSSDTTDSWKYWSSGTIGVDRFVGADQTWVTWVSSDTVVYTMPMPNTKNHKERMKERRKLKRKNAVQARRTKKANRKNMYKRYLEEHKEREAIRKAKELLFDLLEESQRELYERTGRILVKGNKFDWLIRRQHRHSSAISVTRIDKDKVIDMCVYFREGRDLPTDDRMIGYILNAKLSEDDFIKTCNPRTLTRKDMKEVETLINEAACF